MNKKLLYIFAIIFIILAIGIGGTFYYLKTTEEVQPAEELVEESVKEPTEEAEEAEEVIEEMVEEVTEKTIKEITIIKEPVEEGEVEKEFNPQSSGNPHPKISQTPPACCNHPFYHSVYRAVSSDGLSWSKTGGLIKDKASVPAVLQKDDGTFILYYVNGIYDTFDCSTSKDGINFSPGNCTIYGFTEEKAWDPHVVKLDNGFYRLYFFAPKYSLSQGRIMSAISKDGINWLQEPGIRYQQAGILDPAVIKMGNIWRMYVWYGDPPKIVIVLSEDGLNFTKEKETQLGGGIPDIVRIDSGEYAIYYCGQGIEKRISVDGLSWGSSQNVLSSKMGEIICDPAVVKTNDGQWFMYYKVQPLK